MTRTEKVKMNSKHWMILNWTGAPLSGNNPDHFGWSKLEWFSICLDLNSGGNGTRHPGGGTFSIGLALGHVFQQLVGVQRGRKHLAGIAIDAAPREGPGLRLEFSKIHVEKVDVVDGVGCVDLSFGVVKSMDLASVGTR